MSSAEKTDDVEYSIRERIEELLDEYRQALIEHLEGLSEDEARRSLVSSKTTLLGLLKHASYLEGFYYDRALTGRSFTEVGIATTPDRSFILHKGDTIASVTNEYRRRCDASRTAARSIAFSGIVQGDRKRSLWAIHLQMLRELAHHTGHADILREQIMDHRHGRTPKTVLDQAKD